MILDPLFKLMAEKNASDLFITAGTPIHIKIQGSSVPVNQQIMLPDMINKIADELMNDAQRASFKEVMEMNLSIGMAQIGNFRINIFRQRGTVGIVIRFIPGTIPQLAELALPEQLGELIMAKHGLILVVGSTGSGKSTTMAAMLDHRAANKSGHILTIEDPIEFLFKHKKSIINQREVGLDTQSWTNALKSAMRQAPDCILIGEIRDKDTMAMAIAYAQTGHLCLATLHANNSYHALNRIINFFPLENRTSLYLDLSVTLKAIVSQRLARKPNGVRTPAVEVLLNTRHIAELIEKGEVPGIKEAMEQSMAPGCQTFEQDLYRLYKDGTITLEEALATADSPTNLSWLINNSEFGASQPGAGVNATNENNATATSSSPPKQDGASFSEFTLSMSDD